MSWESWRKEYGPDTPGKNMSSTFPQLIARLTDAMAAPHGGDVNEEQCRVEAEIIGYLLGGKIVNKNASYLPEDFANHPTLPLIALDKVATKAYEAFQQESVQ